MVLGSLFVFTLKEKGWWFMQVKIVFRITVATSAKSDQQMQLKYQLYLYLKLLSYYFIYLIYKYNKDGQSHTDFARQKIVQNINFWVYKEKKKTKHSCQSGLVIHLCKGEMTLHRHKVTI